MTTSKKGWERIPTSADEAHVVPVNDLIEHTFEDCVCQPGLDIDMGYARRDVHIYLHHSLDGREIHPKAASRHADE